MNLIDLFPVALVAAVLYRCDASGLLSGTYQDSYLSQTASGQLRGLFAIIVVMNHLYQMAGCGILFPIFTRIGYTSVGFFFFLTGYGLMKRLLSDPEYHRCFLGRRLPSVLVPYVLACVVYWLFNCARGTNYSVADFFIRIAQGNPIVSNSWYIITTLSCYLFFWLSICLLRERPAFVALANGLFCALYTVVCIRLEYAPHWYKSIAAYPLGLCWALWEKPILERIKKAYYLWLSGAVVLFGGTMVIQMHYGNMSSPPAAQAVFSNITIMAFVLCTLLVILKLRIGNRFLGYCGQHSLEIYLYHGMFIGLALPLLADGNGAWRYFLAVLSGTFAFAHIANPINQRLLSAWRRILRQN